MGLTKKTDKLDARGLAILLRNGTLPEVWIPPSELRHIILEGTGVRAARLGHSAGWATTCQVIFTQ